MESERSGAMLGIERMMNEAAEGQMGAGARPTASGAHGADGAMGVPETLRTLHLMPGTLEDLDALSHCHYRCSQADAANAGVAGGVGGAARGGVRRMKGVRPATVACIMSARTETELVGVLVVSRPVLNGPWRDAVWPRLMWPIAGRAGNRARAQLINRELRTISRVIVDPRYRNLGIATHMVRHYLAHPLTPATEALAAMGRTSGFFVRAGMREHRLSASRADRALRVKMRRAGFPAWRLMDVEGACFDILHAPEGSALRNLERALGVWAQRSRATRGACVSEGRGCAVIPPERPAARRVREAQLRALVTLAAMRLGSRPSVFTAGEMGEGGDVQRRE